MNGPPARTAIPGSTWPAGRVSGRATTPARRRLPSPITAPPWPVASTSSRPRVDAAAAKAAGIVNASARAEAVALWMTRLSGLVPHEELVVAMGKAGIAAARAEREVVRLLATDLMLEPRAGHYRFMEP
jgi:hypothetical protein